MLTDGYRRSYRRLMFGASHSNVASIARAIRRFVHFCASSSGLSLSAPCNSSSNQKCDSKAGDTFLATHEAQTISCLGLDADNVRRDTHHLCQVLTYRWDIGGEARLL